jgi:hypothetical protein
MAGQSAERQEAGLIKAINDAVSKNKNNPVTVIAGKIMLEGVIGAEKFSGRQAGGSEPYTDVILMTYDKKQINLSCKGPSAPSLAGGGLKGLELAVPGLTEKFLKEAFNALTTTKKLKPGDKVPDVFGEITGVSKTKIVVGNKLMGGPIDYMYIGPMDVSSNYDEKNNKLNLLRAEFHESNNYAETHKLFFRLRARREDQRFDPLAKDSKGIPKIYGKSPSKGDSAGRIVVTDKVSSGGVIVKV